MIIPVIPGERENPVIIFVNTGLAKDMDFSKIIDEMKPSKVYRAAVAAADEDSVLQASLEAYKRGIAGSVLCGDADMIKKIADEKNIDISPFEIIDIKDKKAAAAEAVRLVRTGEADMLVKGLIETADFLRAVLNKETGLRAGAKMSFVSVIASPVLDRRILLADAAMVMYPDLNTKIVMLNNALRVAGALGMHCPRVAAIAPIEDINPAMPATVDAACLTMMNRRGQISGCIVDGPMAMDLALSEEAVRHKKIVSDVAGKADILLCHDIDVANNTLKTFVHGGGSIHAGIVLGAKAPVCVSSRGDSALSRLYSIACTAYVDDVCSK